MHPTNPNIKLKSFWRFSTKDLLKKLDADKNHGLSESEAKSRLQTYGKNALKIKKRFPVLRLLLSQFNTPFIYILLFSGSLSLFLYDNTDALIIFGIVLVSAFLSFIQENSALQAIDKLQNIVQINVSVIRGGKPKEISLEDVVPGDIIELHAGDMIPGDCYLIESKNLLLDESSLTGESFPVEKSPGIISEGEELSKRSNSLFMGTHVLSGTGKAVVVLTGRSTEFGNISNELEKTTPETEFDKGIKDFGYFLIKVTTAFLVIIFALNVYFQKPILESLMFALTLSVGMTPQLLPAIITVNLAHGAKRMADKKVIVKKLSSIENFGSMNILCADKTGTLTTGKIKFEKACDIDGKESEKVFLNAYLNAFYQSGYKNPIDQAILNSTPVDTSHCIKLDEIAYDFERKRITILLKENSSPLMITKGAFEQILGICTYIDKHGSIIKLDDTLSAHLHTQFEKFSNAGYRVLGIAYRNDVSSLKRNCETNMVFQGFLLFLDPRKPDVLKTVSDLRKLGITLKIITGDNKFAAMHLAKMLNIEKDKIFIGSELLHADQDTISKRVLEKDIFAEVDPSQKEKILLALRQAGNVVGYLGDGINDVTALHAADVSISVNSGADAAKEIADIVLLEKDLTVLKEGVTAGRMTFANTLKYIFMATSANFGNMFSMAGASVFLSFLPLLPKQVMLTNVLTDLPEMMIGTDHVDKSFVNRPLRWNIQFIKKFMGVFGLISSLFDFITFLGLLFILQASPDEFRTGWFVESVLSAGAIVLVIRTFQPFYKSKPSLYLLGMVLLIIAVTVALPFTDLAAPLGFVPISYPYYIFIIFIVMSYIALVEIAKRIFLKRWFKRF